LATRNLAQSVLALALLGNEGPIDHFPAVGVVVNNPERAFYSWEKTAVLLTLEMTYKLFLKMYDNRSHEKESFESSYQLEGSSPVAGLGAVPNGLEAEGHRRGTGGD
jgi:hypothetical protein